MADAILEPVPTKFDKRVLGALDPWSDDRGRRMEFLNAWQVAERIHEYDVRAVRDTLRGLEHLHYAYSRKFDWRQEWIATWRAPEVLA